jgi:hypothetical protein
VRPQAPCSSGSYLTDRLRAEVQATPPGDRVRGHAGQTGGRSRRSPRRIWRSAKARRRRGDADAARWVLVPVSSRPAPRPSAIRRLLERRQKPADLTDRAGGLFLRMKCPESAHCTVLASLSACNHCPRLPRRRSDPASPGGTEQASRARRPHGAAPPPSWRRTAAKPGSLRPAPLAAGSCFV